MANFTFNVAKGRIVEYYNRVDNNDPSTCALLLVPLSNSGTQATAIDQLTLATAISTGGMVRAGGSWGDKVLVDADLVELPAPNTASDRYDVAVPAVTWTAPTAAQNTTGLLVCFRPATGSADSAIIPLTHHDFVVTADGNDVVLNAGNFLQAS